MNSLSRHIACKLCRDRKVRCDGGQPSCEKCLRAGEACIYVPTHKPTKADLAQTIESLQERLDKAEAYILRHGNGHVGASKGTANEKPPTQMPTSAMAVDYSDCAPLNLMMPTTAMPTADSFMSRSIPGVPSTPGPYAHHSHHSHSHSHSHSLPISPGQIGNDFMIHNFLSSPHVGSMHSDLTHLHSHFQMRHHTDDMISVASTASSSFRRDSIFSQYRHVPSLRDLRNINGSSTSTTSPPPSPRPRAARPDDANHILAEFTAFGMAVFSTQAEIAGISSVVAEYLAWMRKVVSSPSSSSNDGSGNEELIIQQQQQQQQQQHQHQHQPEAFLPGLELAKANPAVFEALETRLREVHTLATTRHTDAWRQSVQRLERLPGLAAMLHLFDGEMHRRSGETADFFNTAYDVSQPLSEQMPRKE